MRFWDSSALVPLCLEQPCSAHARELLADDPEMIVWWGSLIEVSSAIARLHREAQLSDADARVARGFLEELREGWYEVQPGAGVREQALRALRIHPLRATDALQLAAALEWSGSTGAGEFVSNDARLSSAAEREGFTAR